ncbi:MAG: tetratricopeptide repeat protein, partial [Thermoguttaceae bacterium]
GGDTQLAARQKYQAAVKTLRMAQGHATLSTNAPREAMYLIGVCFQETGDYRAALAQFTRTRKLFPDSPEGLAANFQEADLSRQFGRDSEALAGYRRVLSTVTDPSNYSNPWLSLEELRSRMLDTYEAYIASENFEACLQLTKMFSPLFSRVRTAKLTAQTYQTWGDSLLAEAEHGNVAKADSLRHMGRAYLRRAGQAYAGLARMQAATRLYPDELWNSANAYMRGQDYSGATALLNEYLKNESRRRHGEALVMLGEAMLSLGKVDSALEAFKECVEFHPRNAAAFRARLMASMGYLEKGDPHQAETLLQENLAGEGMTPRSKEWRDSLFALGELLYTERRYDEAIRRLEEAVVRYPDDPRVLEARYLTANSYRQSAKNAQGKIEKDIGESARNVHSKQVRGFFAQSLEQYQEIRQTLATKNELGELTPLEKSMLRNCSFAIADIYFSTGRYQEAIKAYSTTTNRYQNNPEVLDAYVQIASAYRRLGKPAEARVALQQAKAVLKRIANTADFGTTSNYNPQQWSDLLDWLGSL